MKNWAVGDVVVTDFGETEWSAYAGAESFRDGSSPVLSSIEDGDGEWKSAVVIGGRDRIEIILGAEGERSYSLEVPGLTQAMAIILVAACVRDIVVLLPVNGAPEMPGEAAFLKRYGFVRCRS